MLKIAKWPKLIVARALSIANESSGEENAAMLTLALLLSWAVSIGELSRHTSENGEGSPLEPTLNPYGPMARGVASERSFA